MSPLIEAVCEFRFVLKEDFSGQQTKVFYDQIKDNFPVHEKGKRHQLEFQIRPDKTPEENKEAIKPGVYEFEKYLSEDKKYSVQLNKNTVSIHRVEPYTSWKDFTPLIQQVYEAYVSCFSPEEIERIGMRYINKITTPSEDFSFNKYFTINASLPSLEENEQKSIFLGSVFEQEKGRDAIKVQFLEKQLKNPSTERNFVLDLDYFLVESTVSLKGVDKWIEIAHTNLENVFEGMITDETRKIFS